MPMLGITIVMRDAAFKIELDGSNSVLEIVECLHNQRYIATNQPIKVTAHVPDSQPVEPAPRSTIQDMHRLGVKQLHIIQGRGVYDYWAQLEKGSKGDNPSSTSLIARNSFMRPVPGTSTIASGPTPVSQIQEEPSATAVRESRQSISPPNHHIMGQPPRTRTGEQNSQRQGCYCCNTM